MTTIEIIVHCWAGVHEDYARLLRMQLASIAAWKWQTVRPIVTVAHVNDGSDPATLRVLDEFAGVATPVPLRRGLIFQRNMGRDVLAKRSQADFVWFADCDYLFGPTSLDAIATLRGNAVWYPLHVQILKHHRIGDAILASGVTKIPKQRHFKDTRVAKAIGGLQIVRGDTARRYGYPVKPRHRNEHDDRFRATLGDSSFREEMQKVGVRPQPFEMPNLFRMRHSVCGYRKPEAVPEPAVEHGAFAASMAKKKRWKVDKPLVAALARLCRQQSVCDFGAGLGRYVQELRCRGVGAAGIDGIVGIWTLSDGLVSFGDLSANFHLPARWDWILSLEVGEHIPPERSDTFIENIVRHARRGVVLSWAPPGQRGHRHVNCRPSQWVVDQFARRGWRLEPWLTRYVREAASFKHLQRNLHVFVPEEAVSA